MSQHEPLRPGFHLDTSYQLHEDDVRGVTYNTLHKQLVSWDGRCIKAATCRSQTSSKTNTTGATLNVRVHFDVQQETFVTCLLFVPERELFFAACLDQTLKIYGPTFQLESVMKWHGDVVLRMFFNSLYQELITAGSSGVKVWYCDADREAFSKRLYFELALLRKAIGPAGEPVPWHCGQYQFLKERYTLRVPGANHKRIPPPLHMSDKERNWCMRMAFADSSQLLFVPMGQSVYGYRMRDGQRMFDWERLHGSDVSAVLYMADHGLVFTGAMDGSLKLWSMDERTARLKPMRELDNLASPVESISRHPSAQMFLVASLDGDLRLWNVDGMRLVHAAKEEGPILSLTIHAPEAFFFYSGKQVKVMRLQHVFETFATYNATATSMEVLDAGLVMTQFDDSSVRFIDTTTAVDVVVTLPQMSPASLMSAKCSVARGQLFVLLGDGHIHIWDLHLSQPPVFSEAWTHVTHNARDRVLCFALLDGADVDAGTAELQGLSMAEAGRCDDHVVVGTESGDCLFLDISRGGLPVLSFPAHRGFPVSFVSVDAPRFRLATVSGKALKVWNLRGLKLMKDISYPEKIVRMSVMEETLVLGAEDGTIYLVDIQSAEPVHAPKEGDHEGPVTAVDCNPVLNHFVTGGQDGMVKVFDKAKKLKRTVCMLAPVQCACYLNDQGDILAGLGSRLVVMRADTYQYLASTSQAAAAGGEAAATEEKRTSIYASTPRPADARAKLRFQGFRPLALVANDSPRDTQTLTLDPATQRSPQGTLRRSSGSASGTPRRSKPPRTPGSNLSSQSTTPRSKAQPRASYDVPAVPPALARLKLEAGPDGGAENTMPPATPNTPSRPRVSQPKDSELSEAKFGQMRMMAGMQRAATKRHIKAHKPLRTSISSTAAMLGAASASPRAAGAAASKAAGATGTQPAVQMQSSLGHAATHAPTALGPIEQHQEPRQAGLRTSRDETDMQAAAPAGIGERHLSGAQASTSAATPLPRQPSPAGKSRLGTPQRDTAVSAPELAAPLQAGQQAQRHISMMLPSTPVRSSLDGTRTPKLPDHQKSTTHKMGPPVASRAGSPASRHSMAATQSTDATAGNVLGRAQPPQVLTLPALKVPDVPPSMEPMGCPEPPTPSSPLKYSNTDGLTEIMAKALRIVSNPAAFLAATQRGGEPKKKKRVRKVRHKAKRGAGMSEDQVADWLLEHSKVHDVLVGVLEYSRTDVVTQRAVAKLLPHQRHLAATTPARPHGFLKLPEDRLDPIDVYHKKEQHRDEEKVL